MASKKIRIKLWAYEHSLVDQAAERIVETARRTGSKVSGRSRFPPRRKSLRSCARRTSTRIPANSSSSAPTSA